MNWDDMDPFLSLPMESHSLMGAAESPHGERNATEALEERPVIDNFFVLGW